ncbi:MAG: PQQ-dependent sugar dehydrogenase [Planctomycetota bacterium]
MQNRILVSACGAVAAGLLFATSASAQIPVTTELVASGINRPVWAGSPRGDARIYVVDQSGKIRVIDANGNLLAAPLLDITVPVVGGGGGNDETGFLGLAFHPDFGFNGKFYVYYFGASSRTYLVQYTTPDGFTADPNSALELMSFNQPFSNHNGGCLQFGPDGNLYISLGDGGSFDDPNCNAQNPNSPLGKILRIDVDNVQPLGGGKGSYDIPPSNPFVGVFGLDEIYHYGLRNPWRFSFDRQSGAMYIGDVGQGAWEEVDFSDVGERGLNFGWRVAEGNHNNGLGNCPASTAPFGDPRYEDPIWEYSHGSGFSITGGYVYRGFALTGWQRRYIVADYYQTPLVPKIWQFTYTGAPIAFNNNQQNIGAALDPPGALNLQTPSSFGEDRDGELLICDLGGGEIFRIVPDVGQIPGTAPQLFARFNRLSLTDGGTTYLEMRAGAANAGNPFFMTGTFSGTMPGFALGGGFTLPLNIDAYTNFTLSAFGAPPLVNNFGVLDAEGRATARFVVPPGSPPSFVGKTIHHAYLVFDLATGALQFVSNPVNLKLQA